jgi:hypothetical protein
MIPAMDKPEAPSGPGGWQAGQFLPIPTVCDMGVDRIMGQELAWVQMTTPVGSQRYYFDPDGMESIAKAAREVAVRARSGIIIANGSTPT